MGGTCSTYGGEQGSIQGFGGEIKWVGHVARMGRTGEQGSIQGFGGEI